MPTLLTTLIRKYPPVLAPGFCIESAQQFANAIVNGMTLEFASDIANIGYNYGDTLPDPANRIFPWLRTVDGGFPDDWFVFIGGAWLAPYRRAPGGPNGIRWEWEDTEAALVTFDGGEAGAATATTGPFWEVDHNYDGRSGMGPGAIPNSNPAKTLALAENYGAGSVLQSATQIGPHTHPLQAGASIQDGDAIKVVTSGGGATVGLLIGGSGNADTNLTVGANDPGATQAEVPVVHPVRGLYKIKRTVRVYRRVDV